jgi:hypothetical protein
VKGDSRTAIRSAQQVVAGVTARHGRDGPVSRLVNSAPHQTRRPGGIKGNIPQCDPLNGGNGGARLTPASASAR